MRSALRPLAAATSFLTAVPVGRRTAFDDRDLARAAALFPIVGAAVGALGATVAWGAAQVLPPVPAGVLGVAASVAGTAALHLDGLGDVADGAGASLAGHDPMAAMRDPRLGTFGVVTVALDLVLRVALLAELVAGGGFPWPVVGAAALARSAPVALAWGSRYVGGGTGAWTSEVRLSALVVSAVVGVGVAGATMGIATAWALVGALAFGVALRRWSRSTLGGVTGDVLGAAAELTEVLALVAAVAVRGT